MVEETRSERTLCDYLDGALDDPEREAVEARVGIDEDFALELERARGALDLLRDLDSKRPPRDFLRKVQRRVRRRSGGRYFHPAVQPFGFRLSVEVFVVIAVAVMAACWFMMEPPIQAPTLVDEPALEAPATPSE